MTSDISPAPPRRIIGRILSLGFPLPGVRVDNYSFCSAPAFFDYDALVVDPSALSRLIEGVADGSLEAKTFGDKRVLNVPERADDVHLVDMLRRRTAEVQALIERGGVIVCFAHPATTHQLAGMDPFDDYYWLDDIALMPIIASGEGSHMEIRDYQHPMATFLLGQQANIAYRAHLIERNLSSTAPCLSVVAQSYGGATIAAELPGYSGRIVMLPALKTIPGGEGRYAMSEALQAGIRRMLGVVAEGRAPHWVPHYVLPGMAERSDAVTDARNAAGGAQNALAAAERSHEDLAKYQRLLWQQGQVGLEDVVLDALRLIGCDVYAHDPNALELRVDGHRVLLEIEATDDGPVDLAPHYRLRQRIEAAIRRGGEAPRGAIIINGCRRDLPAERKQQASGALLTAAETMRYALIPTVALFDAVAAKLGGDDSLCAALRRAFHETVGLFEPVLAPPAESA
jgi:hypothetical protein